jgi:ATP-dependent Clp protease ATP-binding subunit ClpA
LAAYRVAGEYRFTEADIEQFLQSQRVSVSIPPGPNHPMARFTERSRKVLTLAHEEASGYHHAGVGPEHVLLAILREGDGVAAIALRDLSVQQDVVRE